jgi:hypothetical protein
MINPHESTLVGQWLTAGGHVLADATEKRIGSLVKNWLIHLADDPVSGAWIQLYRDPADGRLWELTYPQGEMHGGGPRTLRVVSPTDAAQKYDGNYEA